MVKEKGRARLACGPARPQPQTAIPGFHRSLLAVWVSSVCVCVGAEVAGWLVGLPGSCGTDPVSAFSEGAYRNYYARTFSGLARS